LERAVAERIPFIWLAGRQRPDHNTLHRFYQAHRDGLKQLFRRTVRTAVQIGAVELAVQAVDATRIAGNASCSRTHDQQQLEELLERTEAVIAEIESRLAAERQDEGEGPGSGGGLPPELASAQALKQRVAEALKTVTAEGGPDRVNLTDADAALMPTRGGGFITGYQGEAVAAVVPPEAFGETATGQTATGQTATGETVTDETVTDKPAPRGMLITANEVIAVPAERDQLIPLTKQAEAHTGATPGNGIETMLADSGFHSGTTLIEGEAHGVQLVVPDPAVPRVAPPYHKSAFLYDAESDTYRCPEGQTLRFRFINHSADHSPARHYRCRGAICRACPAFGQCTTSKEGRTIARVRDEEAIGAHREWMATGKAKALYRRRKGLIEPVWGLIKDGQAGRRFLLRGLENVRAEWSLMVTAFNLRTIWRLWCHRPDAVVGAWAAAN
jgi:hypothetical protein